MDPILLARFEAAKGRLREWASLDDDLVEMCIRFIVRTKQQGTCHLEKERDVSNWDADDTKAWLRPLGSLEVAPVVVLWPALRSGISARFDEFVDAYDDLWFPSSDDVWVFPPSEDWLLELDHEEIFRYFKVVKEGSR